MSKLKSQKNLINKRDWDCLIVLDACRYDYFEKVYRDYLKGNLQKVISPGSYTIDWLKGTFGDKKYNDTIYVSGNPYINSEGVDLVGFDASEHFVKVIDVWNKYWDEKLKTVHPKYVGKSTRLAKARYPDKKLIAHFMQPHYPYLSIGPMEKGLSDHVARIKRGEEEKDLIGKVREFAGNIAIKVLGEWRVRKLTKIMNLRPLGEMELVAQKHGKGGLRKAYEENLRAVLEEAAKIANRLPGKIIVTSDHGEKLGENGHYSHPAWDNSREIREVPWLEFNKK